MKLFFILQNLHQILLHTQVDFTVAIEGTGTFGMAGERCDQVGIFDLPVYVACKGATSKGAAGDFVQRMLYLFPGDWVKFCSLMKGSRLSPGRFLYFSTISMAMALRGTTTVRPLKCSVFAAMFGRITNYS